VLSLAIAHPLAPVAGAIPAEAVAIISVAATSINAARAVAFLADASNAIAHVLKISNSEN